MLALISKGVEKGVESAGHEVTERVRQWDRTSPVLDSAGSVRRDRMRPISIPKVSGI